MTIIYRILRTYISHFNAVFIEQNESPYTYQILTTIIKTALRKRTITILDN